MAHAAWQGSLTFGMVSIPIEMYPAARNRRARLHLLHAKDHTRLRQPLYCPTCKRIVDRSEVVKGYEYEPGKYVIVGDDEIKKITPRSGRAMEILAFVPQDQVDPIYFDSSFLAVPKAEGRKGYQLLLKALEDVGVMGVAKLDMHQREYTVFIRPRRHGLTFHTMYYANEINKVEEYGKKDDVKLKPQEIKLAEQLVKSLVKDFKPEDYHDEFEDQLRSLVETKLKGKAIVTEAPEPTSSKVINIMDALKKSLELAERRKLAPKEVPRAGRRQKHKAAS